MKKHVSVDSGIMPRWSHHDTGHMFHGQVIHAGIRYDVYESRGLFGDGERKIYLRDGPKMRYTVLKWSDMTYDPEELHGKAMTLIANNYGEPI